MWLQERPAPWKVAILGTALFAWGTLPHRMFRIIAKFQGSPQRYEVPPLWFGPLIGLGAAMALNQESAAKKFAREADLKLKEKRKNI
mmetsp:Transcript_13346/g.18478  ORF Transcript_13346/g.18478 Transcript_13346/m.18478 type:complete len:87 (-) Transcript_13346:187-447(-)